MNIFRFYCRYLNMLDFQHNSNEEGGLKYHNEFVASFFYRDALAFRFVSIMYRCIQVRKYQIM